MKRFHKMWNPGGIDPAVYIALYPPCVTTYIADTEVSEHPIRMFHGISDDYVEIGPCRAYFARLKQSAKDVEMIEYPDTWHAFDYPLFSSMPTVVQRADHALHVEGRADRNDHQYRDAEAVHLWG